MAGGAGRGGVDSAAPWRGSEGSGRGAGAKQDGVSAPQPWTRPRVDPELAWACLQVEEAAEAEVWPAGQQRRPRGDGIAGQRRGGRFRDAESEMVARASPRAPGAPVAGQRGGPGRRVGGWGPRRPRRDRRAGLAAARCVAPEQGSPAGPPAVRSPRLHWAAVLHQWRWLCSTPKAPVSGRRRNCGSCGGSGSGMASVGPQAPEEYQGLLGTVPTTSLKQE